MAEDKAVHSLSDLVHLSGEERMHQFMKMTLAANQPPEGVDWMTLIQPHLSIVSHDASDRAHPRVTFRLTVQTEHCNKMMNMHGGCTATVFDFCTSIPTTLVARPGFWFFFGVSRTLNVTYLRPVPCGETVLIDCEVVHMGNRLCALRGTMRRESDGAVMAICEHGKANTDPPAGKL